MAAMLDPDGRRPEPCTSTAPVNVPLMLRLTHAPQETWVDVDMYTGVGLRGQSRRRSPVGDDR